MISELLRVISNANQSDDYPTPVEINRNYRNMRDGEDDLSVALNSMSNMNFKDTTLSSDSNEHRVIKQTPPSIIQVRASWKENKNRVKR